MPGAPSSSMFFTFHKQLGRDSQRLLLDTVSVQSFKGTLSPGQANSQKHFDGRTH